MHQMRAIPGECGHVEQQQGVIVFEGLSMLLAFDVKHAEMVRVERGHELFLVATDLHSTQTSCVRTEDLDMC